MILQVSMPFRARIVPSGRRDEVERVGRAPVFVEVREMGAAEAPEVLRYRDAGQTRALRAVSGRLWGPATGAARDAEGLRAIAAAPPRADDPFGRAVLAGAPLAEADAARQRFSNEEALRARLHEAAAGLLVVEGVLHVPAAEPVYVVDASGAWPRVRVGPPGKADDPLATFSAAERAFVEAAFGVAIDPADRIEVLDAAALGAGVAGRAVLRAAGLAKGRLAALIADRDWETFSAYKGLRDAVAALPGSDGAELGAVPERLRACLDGPVGLDAHTAEVVSRALARLEGMDLADLPAPR